MSDAKTFKCPSCGSALEPDGDEKEVKCAYCGSTVIVPQELRGQVRYLRMNSSASNQAYSGSNPDVTTLFTDWMNK